MPGGLEIGPLCMPSLGLRRVASAGLTQSPMARSPNLLAGPKLAEWPGWLVFPPNHSLNYEYLATGPVASVSQVLQVERRRRLQSYSHPITQLKTPALCLIQTKSLDLKKAVAGCDSVELPSCSKTLLASV